MLKSIIQSLMDKKSKENPQVPFCSLTCQKETDLWPFTDLVSLEVQV